MSKETQWALENRFLIGFTEQRGHAWHWRGVGDNHFPHEVPLERVRSLLGYTVEAHHIYLADGTEVPGKRAIVADDDGTVFSVFGDSYVPHQPYEWLVENVETILDDNIKVAGVGLPRNRSQAYVQVELPETVTIEGVGEDVRPYIVAMTSFDGSLATNYSTGLTRIVCDNTLSMFHRTAKAQHKIKHTKGSGMRKAEVVDALGILHSMTEEYEQAITELTRTEVTQRAWDKFLDTVAPMPDEKASKRAITFTVKKRDTLNELYNSDERVAPWRGTAWGVFNAMNTYNHHMTQTKGSTRMERNAEAWISGKFAQYDADTLSIIREITAAV